VVWEISADHARDLFQACFLVQPVISVAYLFSDGSRPQRHSLGATIEENTSASVANEVVPARLRPSKVFPSFSENFDLLLVEGFSIASLVSYCVSLLGILVRPEPWLLAIAIASLTGCAYIVSIHVYRDLLRLRRFVVPAIVFVVGVSYVAVLSFVLLFDSRIV
jgi:hypothetical protein